MIFGSHTLVRASTPRHKPSQPPAGPNPSPNPPKPKPTRSLSSLSTARASTSDEAPARPAAAAGPHAHLHALIAHLHPAGIARRFARPRVLSVPQRELYDALRRPRGPGAVAAWVRGLSGGNAARFVAALEAAGLVLADEKEKDVGEEEEEEEEEEKEAEVIFYSRERKLLWLAMGCVDLAALRETLGGLAAGRTGVRNERAGRLWYELDKVGWERAEVRDPRWHVYHCLERSDDTVNQWLRILEVVESTACPRDLDLLQGAGSQETLVVGR